MNRSAFFSSAKNRIFALVKMQLLKKCCKFSLCGFWSMGVAMAVIAMFTACSTAKYVPDGEYLLQQVEIKSVDKDFDAGQLRQYVKQKGNSKWFSTFKIPLGVYSLSGPDTTKWFNRLLRKIGEEPVLYDSLQMEMTKNDLLKALQNNGYMNAKVDHEVKIKGKKLKDIYTLTPGSAYLIRKMSYVIDDDSIRQLLLDHQQQFEGLQEGARFTVNGLESERNKVTAFLMDNGYYKFHKEYIRFQADTMRGSRLVDVTLHLMRYREQAGMAETLHPRYMVRNVHFVGADSSEVHIKPNTLKINTAVKPGEWYSASDVQRTYNNFGRLGAIRFTNIRFSEIPGSNELDCTIQYGVNKPSTISLQPEGTNTAGDFGAAMSITYQNRNIFRGSEMLSVQLRGAYEAITGLEGYQNQNYMEYNVESKLSFPRFAAPLLKTKFKEEVHSTSELTLSYNLQNRPEFHRRVFSAGWRYRWAKPRDKWTFKWDLVDLNYIYMPWISSTFKHEYIDSVNNRNVILRYNYEDLFIVRTGFGFTYNDGVRAIKANVETGGNLLKLASSLLNFKINTQGQQTLFNIAFAQYFKSDFDFTRAVIFDDRNSLVFHAGIGVAYPYGNSTVLPFEKRYFSGGANSVRGWRVRGLGPGSYMGRDGNIDFINQTGDMRLDFNLEYRTKLFWKFNGAFFVDAGNVWTLRDYEEQPGGQFRLDEFYQQIAVAYGLGIRLNFDYFILRFDMGMKAVNPAYESYMEHYPILYPELKRDFAFHFAVGMPF